MVSKLLGHKNLKTMQINSKIIDERKVQAVNLLPGISILRNLISSVLASKIIYLSTVSLLYLSVLRNLVNKSKLTCKM